MVSNIADTIFHMTAMAYVVPRRTLGEMDPPTLSKYTVVYCFY